MAYSPRSAADDDADVHNPMVALEAATQLKTIGTFIFKKGDWPNAQKKCGSFRLLLPMTTLSMF